MILELNCNYNCINIYGLLYSPDRFETKLPLVILCHGLFANHTWLEYYAKQLVKENILCYLFDFCGADNSRSDGDSIHSSVLTEKEDLDSVIERISKLECVDDKQVYIFGHSQGGLVASMCANNNIKGLFLLSPAFNVPLEMSKITPPDEGEFTRILPGLVGRKYVTDARSINVELLFTQYEGEVIIFHGDMDNAVPMASSINACNKYKNAQLIVLDNEKHNLSLQGQQEVLKHIIRRIKGE